MFLFLVWLLIAIVVLGMAYIYKATGDIFHPLMIVFPMFGFIYGWMPLQLHYADILGGFFYPEQLWFVQAINDMGVLAFFIGSAHLRPVERLNRRGLLEMPDGMERRLLVVSAGTGLLGLAAWVVAIRNVGGVVEAFSHPYSGGWDDSGYIRDGSLVMFSAVVLAAAVFVHGRRRWTALSLVVAFILPWCFQAILTSRRGPSFMIVAVLGLAVFLYRGTRPPAVAALLCGLVLGYGILLLVVNRNQIYWGSDLDLNSDVNRYVKTNDGSNEYIYGAGSILDSYYTSKHYWGRRYLSQLVVRPIPSALWPTKYEDFGIAGILQNAGNSTTFVNTLGWTVPPGAAPGIVADLWVEVSWLAVPALWLAGRTSSWIWFRAVSRRSYWAAQYCICAALAIYFVMQTMEAVIFRFVLLSAPIWFAWKWAGPFGSYTDPLEHLPDGAMDKAMERRPHLVE